MYVRVLNTSSENYFVLVREVYCEKILCWKIISWSFWVCSRMEGRLILTKISHIYPTMMKLGTVIPCLKKIEKHMNQVTHPVNSADIYYPEICKFSYIKKYRYRLHFDTWFLILITFFWVFKNFFNKHANNLDDVSENGYFRPFEIKISWKWR